MNKTARCASGGSIVGVIVSVNVGLPQDVTWQGRTVRTAIWKKPVTGRIFAGRLNLDGDGQGDLGGHGGEQRALMVYQLESYRYWANYLGRSDLVPGSFGERGRTELLRAARRPPRRQRQCQQDEAGQAPRGVRGGHERDGTDDPIRELRFDTFRAEIDIASRENA